MSNTNIQNIEKGIRDLRMALNNTSMDQEFVLLLSIKALSDSRPNPCWIKGTNGRMLYVNPAYTSEFGIEPEEYIGDKDSKHWGDATAAIFRGNDNLVASRGTAMTFIEDVPMDGNTVKYKIVKWPVYLRGKLVGIAGESLGAHVE